MDVYLDGVFIICLVLLNALLGVYSPPPWDRNRISLCNNPAICRPGWLQTDRDPSASAPRVLGLKVNPTAALLLGAS